MKTMSARCKPKMKEGCGAGGEVLGLLQTEHSGIGFNPFVNESHVQCKSLLLLHWTTRASSGACTQLRPSQVNTDSSGSVRAVTNQWGSPLYMFDYDFTFRQSVGLREPWKESKSLTPLFLCRPILLTLRCFLCYYNIF